MWPYYGKLNLKDKAHSMWLEYGSSTCWEFQVVDAHLIKYSLMCWYAFHIKNCVFLLNKMLWVNKGINNHYNNDSLLVNIERITVNLLKKVY